MNKNTFGKKLLIVLLSSSAALTCGCSGKDNVPDFSYQEQPSASTINLGANDSSSDVSGYLLASDKCVINESDIADDDNMSCNSFLLLNQTDKKVLLCNNPYNKLYPASITKILTAYITLKYCNMDDIVTVSHDAANITEEGAKLCGFNEGDRISVRDLLYSMMVYSGNDAASALGDFISGSNDEFASLMNEELQKLGAANTHFTNPSGLHNDNHYTTAYDLYLIFSECIKNSEFKNIINTSSYTAEYEDASGNSVSKTFETTNRFLLGSANAPEGITVVGGKTGTTSKAGYCLMLYSTDDMGKDYISIVLGADSGDSLYSQMEYLLGNIN